jgi:hypothetical protein
MRRQDREIFRQTAIRLKLWLLVRRTNEASLAYIGRPGYYPKPIDCKCKTADKDGYPGKKHAGLVVDPSRFPRSFHGAKLPKALAIWNEFLSKHGRLGPHGNKVAPPSNAQGYGVVDNPRSEHEGVVTLNRLYLHGDYDLYDIIDPKEPRRNEPRFEILHGERHMSSPHLEAVKTAINNAVGVPVIQHGGEMQYTGHSEQTIDGFMPSGDTFEINTLNGIREVYQIVFEGRKPAGKL